MIGNHASKKQKIYALVSAAALCCIAAGAAVLNAPATAQERPQAPEQTTAQPVQTASPEGFAAILDETDKQLALQNEVDAELMQEMNSGRYTFASPLVVNDPYSQSPLTAMVVFTTEQPEQISIHIAGEDSLSDVDFSFSGYGTGHMIPVYGLYPNKENQVTLTATDRQGNRRTAQLTIKTEPLPDSLSQNIIQTDLADRQEYQPGLNFCFFAKTAFDANGKYRWFLNGEYLQAGMYAYQNHYMVARGSYEEGDVLFYEINPMGRIFRVLYSPYGVHHDIAAYKDGNLLVTGSHGSTTEDFMYEVNVQTGAIQNTLDLKTVFQRLRPGMYDASSSDWLHLNAIYWAGDNKLLISGRRQSVVAQISWPEGKIDWMLASPDGWQDMYKKYLLTPVGDTELPYNQHAPVILPDMDNNPDTMDILLFDNGDQRFSQTEEWLRDQQQNVRVNPALYSRMVQYRIDEKKKTVEQVWEFGKEQGSKLYSYARGNAELLANGNRLGLFSIGNDVESKNANYIEVNRDGKIVWQAYAVSSSKDGSYTEYRTERLDIYNDAANNLQTGTPAVNLIPQEVYERYGIQKNG